MNPDTPWAKASKSGGNSAQCVEVRRHDGNIQVRDSKDPDGPILTFTPNRVDGLRRRRSEESRFI